MQSIGYATKEENHSHNPKIAEVVGDFASGVRKVVDATTTVKCRRVERTISHDLAESVDSQARPGQISLF